MNKDEVTEAMAQYTTDVGYIGEINTAEPVFVEFSMDSLVRFANACEKIGMEKAANICKTLGSESNDGMSDFADGYDIACKECAEAIGKSI